MDIFNAVVGVLSLLVGIYFGIHGKLSTRDKVTKLIIVLMLTCAAQLGSTYWGHPLLSQQVFGGMFCFLVGAIIWFAF